MPIRPVLFVNKPKLDAVVAAMRKKDLNPIISYTEFAFMDFCINYPYISALLVDASLYSPKMQAYAQSKLFVLDGKTCHQANPSLSIVKSCNLEDCISSLDYMQNFERNSACLYIFSGPSGSGKSDIIKRASSDGLVQKLISCTDRKPRDKEANSRDHIFLGREDFEALENEMIYSYVGKSGTQYGFPPSLITLLKDGIDCAVQIKKKEHYDALKRILSRYVPDITFFHVYVKCVPDERARRITSRSWINLEPDRLVKLREEQVDALMEEPNNDLIIDTSLKSPEQAYSLFYNRVIAARSGTQPSEFFARALFASSMEYLLNNTAFFHTDNEMLRQYVKNAASESVDEEIVTRSTTKTLSSCRITDRKLIFLMNDFHGDSLRRKIFLDIVEASLPFRRLYRNNEIGFTSKTPYSNVSTKNCLVNDGVGYCFDDQGFASKINSIHIAFVQKGRNENNSRLEPILF